MSSETITRNDLTNILNDVLPSAHYGSIYRASWTASSSSANSTPLTGDITIPAGTYVVNCISPIASANVSIAIAGQYKEMIKSGDSFTIIYSCNDTVTFHVSSAQSASVTFSYTERGSLTAIQISEQGVATNVTDYIVEQGTDGYWEYTKWDSGKYEAFFNEQCAMGVGTAWCGGYYHACTYPIPLPSFALTWKLVSANKNDGILSWCVGVNESPSGHITHYWVNGASGSASGSQFGYCNITIQGTWK